MKKAEREAKKLAKDFADAYPVGTEVAVLGDDGKRHVCIVQREPVINKVDDTFPVLMPISRIGDAGDTECQQLEQVPIDRVRGRAIERRRTTNQLRVELTSDERQNAGQAMADAVAQVDSLKAQLDSVKKQIGAQVQAAEAMITAKAELLRAGYEIRPVDCELLLAFDQGRAAETRTDTGETIADRGLYPEECEMGLDLFPEQAEQGEPEPDPDTPQETPPQADEPVDPILVNEAKEIIMATGRASISTVQRKLKVGYPLADRIMTELEKQGVVGPPNGSEPREILVSNDENADAGAE